MKKDKDNSSEVIKPGGGQTQLALMKSSPRNKYIPVRNILRKTLRKNIEETLRKHWVVVFYHIKIHI